MKTDPAKYEQIILETVKDTRIRDWIMTTLNQQLQSMEHEQSAVEVFQRLGVQHLNEQSFVELIKSTEALLSVAPESLLGQNDWLHWVFYISITTGKVKGLVTCVPELVLPNNDKPAKALRLNDELGRTCEFDNQNGIVKIIGKEPTGDEPGFSLQGGTNQSPFSMVLEYTPDPESKTFHPVITEMSKNEINSALFEWDMKVGQVKYPNHREKLIEHIVLLRACKDLSVFSKQKAFYQVLLSQMHRLFEEKREHDKNMDRQQGNALVSVAEDIIQCMTPQRIEAFEQRIAFSMSKRAQAPTLANVVEVNDPRLIR